MAHSKTVLLKDLPDLGNGEKFPLAKTQSAREKRGNYLERWVEGCEN